MIIIKKQSIGFSWLVGMVLLVDDNDLNDEGFICVNFIKRTALKRNEHIIC